MDKLVDEYIKKYGRTPLEIICEQERLREQIEVIESIKEILSEKQFNVLWLYCVEGWTQERIGVKYKITQQAIDKHLNTILNRIQKRVVKSTKNGIKFYKELFLPNESTLEAHGAKYKIRYPSEYFSNINNGQRKKRGKEDEFINTETCIVDKYLDESFKDDKTICTQCNKCTNKVMKERKQKYERSEVGSDTQQSP